MPRAMATEVENVIVQALSRGLSREQISGVVGVSARSVTRISSNMAKYGTPRPPPKGLKLGRPARVTRAQAEAMLAWMSERDQNFFVKDLCTHLQENYNYKGSHATVRRCLIRAGFKRKLPWHRSEKTTWLPPDHTPIFEIIREAGDHRGENQNTEESENHGEEQAGEESEEEGQQNAHIDPALQDAASSALLGIENHQAIASTPIPLSDQPGVEMGVELPNELSYMFAPSTSALQDTNTGQLLPAIPHLDIQQNMQPSPIPLPQELQPLHHQPQRLQLEYHQPQQSQPHRPQQREYRSPPAPQRQPQNLQHPPIPHPHPQPPSQLQLELDPSTHQLHRPRGRPRLLKSSPTPKPQKLKPLPPTSITQPPTIPTTLTPSPNLTTQLLTLQSEVARQQELIVHLQQQLLAQQHQQNYQQQQQHSNHHHPNPQLTATEDEFRHQLLAAAEIATVPSTSQQGGGVESTTAMAMELETGTGQEGDGGNRSDDGRGGETGGEGTVNGGGMTGEVHTSPAAQTYSSPYLATT